jgi:hypothetical protein
MGRACSTNGDEEECIWVGKPEGKRPLGRPRRMWMDNIKMNLRQLPGKRSRHGDWLWAGRPRGRSSSPGRVKNFLFTTSSRPNLGSTQLPIPWAPGALSLGVKRPGREADHSSPASAEAKKMWIYISTLPTPSWRSA